MNAIEHEPVSLSTLKPGAFAVICGYSEADAGQKLSSRMMEMGLTVGVALEVAHEAPFGGAIAVRCRGALIALRLDDAQIVQVRRL